MLFSFPPPTFPPGPRHPLLLRPPRRLERFVLLEEINFNHNFSHWNCNSSMINDCSQHHTQLFQFQFLFLSNRNMILPERAPCQFFFPPSAWNYSFRCKCNSLIICQGHLISQNEVIRWQVCGEFPESLSGNYFYFLLWSHETVDM